MSRTIDRSAVDLHALLSTPVITGLLLALLLAGFEGAPAPTGPLPADPVPQAPAEPDAGMPPTDGATDGETGDATDGATGEATAGSDGVPPPIDGGSGSADGAAADDDAVVPAPDAVPSPGATYPARPADGTLYWGAAVQGNGDPVPRHETPSGHVLGLRRTFFSWSQRLTGLLDIVDADQAAGRLPWVSLKTPSWAEMAAGDHDVELEALLQALASRSGPVWLTFHHEPEGGGGVNSPDDLFRARPATWP